MKKFKRSIKNVEDSIIFKRLKYKKSRKQKLTEKVIYEIAENVERGHSLASSAIAAGISDTGLRKHLTQGRAEEDRLEMLEAAEGIPDDYEMSVSLKLVLAIKQAVFLSKNKALIGLEEAIKKGNVQGITWYLERKFPDEFGLVTKEKIEVSQKTETVIIVPEIANNDKDWEKVRLKHEAKKGLPAPEKVVEVVK